MTSRSAPPGQSSLLDVFLVALRLGLVSFGGPIAHLAYFRNEYVERRRWLDEATYAEVVALCQSLPGPTSSEVGIAIGLLRAGPAGAVAAWLGFTLPSAIALVLFALFVDQLGEQAAGWIHGLSVVAVAVVALAVWSMARGLAWDALRGPIALAAAAAALAFPSALTQIAIIVVGGAVGWALLRGPTLTAPVPLAVPIGRRVALACASLFLALLVVLPLARVTVPRGELALFDAFYRAGALVFGGGHVVLPLLHAEVVPSGWVAEDRFLAGYGAAQAVPGPLFTFAAYLGAVTVPSPCSSPLVICGGFSLDAWPPTGPVGAALALIAIFLPAFLLVFAALPSWGALRARADAQAALRGINAAVVGILLAALITPVASSAIRGPVDAAFALAALAMLLGKLPPWFVVITIAAIASVLR
ncbi:MAG TPA: chromate efflux transporter [Candidatus Limnocylindria bacterium]|nr:chromate efflux transporter [Candidatus Limnocylindria bacterium]